MNDWITEEEDRKENEYIDINQIWEISQNIARDVNELKKNISKNDGAYGIE